jgi:hypothetical protein
VVGVHVQKGGSARNLEDWADIGKLVDVGVEIHFATENLDLRTVASHRPCAIPSSLLYFPTALYFWIWLLRLRNDLS